MNWDEDFVVTILENVLESLMRFYHFNRFYNLKKINMDIKVDIKIEINRKNKDIFWYNDNDLENMDIEDLIKLVKKMNKLEDEN